MRYRAGVALLGILLGVRPIDCSADETPQVKEGPAEADSERDRPEKRPRSFTAIPLVDQSPTLGTGFGGMALYFLEPDKSDRVSPPSMLSFLGLYSNTDSYLLAAPVKLFLREDTWRVSGAYARFRINYDFDYEIDGEEVGLAYTELRDTYFLALSRKVYRDFYVGFLYMGWDTRFRLGDEEGTPGGFTRSVFEQDGITGGFESSLGFVLSYDTRDYPYYPTRGINASVRPKFFGESLGGESDYTDVDYAINGYHSAGAGSVLAWRVSGGSASGDVPFGGYQSYGVRNSLRGYAAGKYRGPHMFAAQVEYRWRLRGRWGLVGFVGSGRVWGDEEETSFGNSEWLPSIGGGIRFMVLEERKINIRVDYGWGRNGNHGLYIGLMEAF